MEPAATTTSPTEAQVLGGARRLPRIRIRQLAVPFLVLAAVGVLGGVALHLRQETQATNTRLGEVRSELHRAVRQLARAQAELQATEASSSAVQGSLTAATQDLASLEGQLSRAELSQFVGGVNISAVQTCLGGVQLALNELGLGNAKAAVASLTPVADSCRTALAS